MKRVIIYLSIIFSFLPIYASSKGINITKDQFIKSFCSYMQSPDITKEKVECPIDFISNGDDGDYQLQIGYSATLQDDSIITIGVNKKNHKITGVSYQHKNSESIDIVNVRYAIISAIDKNIPHNEEFYNLISAGKAIRGSYETPVVFNKLKHNHIDYSYGYRDSDDSLVFRADNDF